MSCCCFPFPRRFPSDLQPTSATLPTSFDTPLSKAIHRVVLFYDRPPLSTGQGCCLGTDHLYAPNSHYPLELLAYRQIGDLILTLLHQDSRRPPEITVEACEYTNETHLAQARPLPPCNVLVNLNHDWPTVHEDPIWAARWLRLLVQTPTVPSLEQIVWLFEKSKYVENVITCDPTLMLPTSIVRHMDDIAGAYDHCEGPSKQKKIVCKENFSAGKEGVTFVSGSTRAATLKKMATVQKQAGCPSTQTSKVATRHRSSAKKQEARAVQDSMEYIDRVFAGGNKGVYIVQKYEPRFLTAHEKRLFYSKGTFLYAMSHRGWIGANAQPVCVAQKELGREQQKVARLLDLLPRLALYPLVRFDFGPGALLSEIEVLPDLFGGPAGNVQGKQWNEIKVHIANAYVEDIVVALGWGSTAVVL